MRRRAFGRAATGLLGLVLVAGLAGAQDAPSPEAIKAGAHTYASNCSPCHGARMQDPEGAFDLKTFPRGQRDRFFRSVRNGKNAMPPWGGVLSTEEIEGLWAYVSSGGG
ncbi:c-type cytochrome [Paracraurococcus lichenis]|uniref:Cytochrome c n=1 Tax=Paracraurococcus lichenis TaxID=3064888 RepID=A0ABT9E3T4_9PROT|nr:cytochrome c [Paracraurococcus sp. LOR1-02]MDO9710821.1 cytochrome c [Paracraurococcus sp. LOR1-02]